jgi:excisionase family DNA binding protein
VGAERARSKAVGDVVKVYTVDEVASLLKLEYKTVLRLIKRSYLKCLPGIRHKRITEQELSRYLDVRGILASAASNPSARAPVLAKPECNPPATLPARPARMEPARDKSLVGPTAKAVAPPVAQSSQRK